MMNVNTLIAVYTIVAILIFFGSTMLPGKQFSIFTLLMWVTFTAVLLAMFVPRLQVTPKDVQEICPETADYVEEYGSYFYQ